MVNANDLLTSLGILPAIDEPTIDTDEILQEFSKLLTRHGIDNIQVDDVELSDNNSVLVEFSDQEDQEFMEVIFYTSELEGPQAIILTDEDDNLETEDDQEITLLDLEQFEPPVFSTSEYSYLDLTQLDWISKDLLDQMFTAGSLTESVIKEAFTMVVRNGKKVKVPIVKRRTKKILTPAQKAGIRKGVQKRKAKKGQTAMKRKKSLKIRKRMKLKAKPKGFKVGGS